MHLQPQLASFVTLNIIEHNHVDVVVEEQCVKCKIDDVIVDVVVEHD